MDTQAFERAKRIVIKAGSALVANNGAGPDRALLADWARQIAELKSQGREVLFVTSGAVASGCAKLGFKARPKSLSALAACAAAGQMDLAQAYQSAFAACGIPCAQILLTHDDFADRKRFLNAKSTLETLLACGAVPVINENDAVSTDEIKFGDNDALAAMAANLCEAGALILLTDCDGLYDSDPRQNPGARLIAEGLAGDPLYEQYAGGAGSAFSKGGMATKTRAAARAAQSGAHTRIANGRAPGAILLAASGARIGTALYASQEPLAAKKRWLASQLRPAGSICADAGAVLALLQGKSLLPAGACSIRGRFERGACVEILGPDGAAVARGLANYGSSEARLLCGKSTADILPALGYQGDDELIHRDNLALLRPGA